MRNISLTQQYKQAVTDWNAKQQFTLFGTCQFMFKSNRTIEDRKKAVMRFWNAVDRTIYTAKEIATEGKRVERIVYLEQGRSRDYVHFHFFGYKIVFPVVSESQKVSLSNKNRQRRR